MRTAISKIAAVLLAVLVMTSILPMGLQNYPGPDVTVNPNPEGILNDIMLDPGELNLTNDYQKIWEPNNIRGSTHAVAVSDSGEYMATAGGYLNDREVHIYRWLDSLNQYYPIWDAGDTEIQGDVMDVDFMDAD
ncbi:MAG: hypothetical protein ACFFEW_16535, partial [Candidatus Thorarchaeota archaeon]